MVQTADPRLVRWAKESSLTNTTGQVAHEFSIASARVVAAATQISEAGARMCGRNEGDQLNLRGAVAERITRDLISVRSAKVDTERKVSLVDGSETNHVDVLVDDDPFEAYECKAKPGRLDQGDIDQLTRIRGAAQARTRTGIVGVLTLENWRSLERAVANLNFDRDVWHSCQNDLLELTDGPPRRRLGKQMSASHSGL